MPRPSDYRNLLAAHTRLIERINAGEAGLPLLDTLMRAAQEALGAVGMTFAEYGPAGGRIIAAIGASDWALGRPVDPTEPTTARLLAGPPTQVVAVEQLPGELSDHLVGRGMRFMAGARAEINGVVIGSLHAFYTADQEPPDGEHETLIGWLASGLAHMYGDQAGLPVHGDGPVVAALADGLAIIEADGTVRLWNPAAEQVTGQPSARVLNRPVPFPVPQAGQVLDHRLPDGRWIEITSGELPGTVHSRVVTFRDITDQHARAGDRDLFVAVTSHELRTPVTVITR